MHAHIAGYNAAAAAVWGSGAAQPAPALIDAGALSLVPAVFNAIDRSLRLRAGVLCDDVRACRCGCSRSRAVAVVDAGVWLCVLACGACVLSRI